MKNRILVLILVVSLTLLATGVTLAESSHTDAEISTDKSDYKPYEMVTISGVRFVPNSEVNVEVIRPDGALSCWIVNSDGEGNFATTYQPDGTAGTYIAKASDGINGQKSQFTLTGPVTDLNRDKTVNIFDLTVVAAAYGTGPGDEKWNALADLDKSGMISIPDVTIVAKDYGKTV